ncbi:hypothetical protein AP064_05115 [Candidatus Liberibacter solanacearum]|uniref:Uncharacterized protein n=1 Tax=Candidatus Liberibacter solanacearum TaxID=556287 RepID=A0A0F4VPA9_9HYPH|nr:hypothetical protein [Candidatus Liberibacter solanacearum]KJZ82512.1 hypothetical protein DJ66_0119 [Candidatus Liberibacter solanacearum]KQC48740.1 hypothetical protein AP064_05115 [Candidatus Liberibacter solanacearum]
MTTELQEDFKNYVFENVKANIDEWDSLGYRDYGSPEIKKRFRDKITELRRQYAKENGLKTVTQLCPKPSYLVYPVRAFRDEYINSEEARLLEEFKPLAIAKIANDEELKDKLNVLLVKGFSKEFVLFGGRDYCREDVYLGLLDALREHYKEVQHTLSNSSDVVKPDLRDLASECLTSLFTPRLTLKSGNTEQIKQVA